MSSLQQEEKSIAKEEIYSFFDEKLEKNEIFLGKSGPNWDKEREAIDTIVIHHTANNPDISLKRLNTIQLLNLYAVYYNNPAKHEEHIKRTPIYSNHFQNNQQIFYGYHWFIRMDGSTQRLLNDNQIGWHCGNWSINKKSIAICLDNNYDNSIPSKKLLEKIANIITTNYPQVKIENIKGHREIKTETSCPGNTFLSDWKQELLQFVLKNKQNIQ